MGDNGFFSKSFFSKEKENNIKELSKNFEDSFSCLDFHTAAMELKKDIIKNFQETLFKNPEFLEEIKKKISDKVPVGEVYGIFLENCNSRMASEDLSLTEDQKTLLSSLFEQKDDPDINSCNSALLGPLKEWLSLKAEPTDELLEKLNKDLDTVFDLEQAKLQEVETARQDAAAARVEADEKTEAEAFPEDKKAAAPASGWLSWGVSFIPGLGYRKAEVASPEPNLQAEWDLGTLSKLTQEKLPGFKSEMASPKEGQQFNDLNRMKNTEIIFLNKEKVELKGFSHKREGKTAEEGNKEFEREIEDAFGGKAEQHGIDPVLAKELKEYCHQGGYLYTGEDAVKNFFAPEGITIKESGRSSKLEILENGVVKFTEKCDFVEIRDTANTYGFKEKGELKVEGTLTCTSFLSLKKLNGKVKLQQTEGKVKVKSESPILTQLFTALDKKVKAAEVAPEVEPAIAAAEAVPVQAAGLATTVISGIGSGIGSGLSTVTWGVGSVFTGVGSVFTGVGSAVTSVANMGGALVGAVSSRLRPQELELELGLELGLELECTLDSLSRVSNKKLESKGVISELEKMPETVVQAPQGKNSEEILKQKIVNFLKEGRESVPAALVSSFFMADQANVEIKKNVSQSLLKKLEDGRYELTQVFDFSGINDTGNNYRLQEKGHVQVAGTMTCTSILSLDENGELQQTEGQVKIHSNSPELKTLLNSLKKKIESLGENLEAEWDLDVLSQVTTEKLKSIGVKFNSKMTLAEKGQQFADLDRAQETRFIFRNRESVQLKESFSAGTQEQNDALKENIDKCFLMIEKDTNSNIFAEKLQECCHQGGYLYTAEMAVTSFFGADFIQVNPGGGKTSTFEILENGTVKFTETCRFIGVTNGGPKEKYGLQGAGAEEEVTGTLTCTSILSLDADGNLQQTKGKVKVTSSDSLLLKQLFSELDKEVNELKMLKFKAKMLKIKEHVIAQANKDNPDGFSFFPIPREGSLKKEGPSWYKTEADKREPKGVGDFLDKAYPLLGKEENRDQVVIDVVTEYLKPADQNLEVVKQANLIEKINQIIVQMDRIRMADPTDSVEADAIEVMRNTIIEYMGLLNEDLHKVGNMEALPVSLEEIIKDFNLIMGIEVEAQVEEERKDKAEEDRELERKPTKPVIFSQRPAEGTARPEVTKPKAEEDKEAEAVDKPSSPKI